MFFFVYKNDILRKSPVNPAYYESDMSWNLHRYLAEALKLYGIAVVMTRPNHTEDLKLEERGRKAAGCDLFLSIHSNACGDTSQDYPLACCCVSGKMDKLGQLLADEVHTVMGTKQAGRIWKRQGNNGDYYGVLRGAAKVGVPGILLEHSFHTNKTATNWLLRDANLKKLAEAEAAVIASYYGLKKCEKPVTQKPAENKLASGKAYLMRVTCDALNIRAGAGTSYAIKGCIRDKGTYTIVETKNGWGKLKSGAGWICLAYTKKV